MSDKGFDYEKMMDEAMRSVAARALAEAAAHGLPGNHHFYISFRTGAEGVMIPARLKAQYPEEMTIVVQFQYWNLAAHDDAFEVELSFGGKRERLYVPYVALTAFVDPHAEFGLKFGAAAHAAASTFAAMPATQGTASAGTPPPTEPPSAGEKVVPLDQFRKK